MDIKKGTQFRILQQTDGDHSRFFVQQRVAGAWVTATTVNEENSVVIMWFRGIDNARNYIDTFESDHNRNKNFVVEQRVVF